MAAQASSKGEPAILPSVLFVCLGNICRSPLAELALRTQAAAAGLAVTLDSAGIGDWHIGLPPDHRARAVARAMGHSIDTMRARQIVQTDFVRFDHIVALDRQNMAALQEIRPDGATARLSLLMDHVAGRAGEDVFDPYYAGEAAFLETWEDVSHGASGLIAMLGMVPQPDSGNARTRA